MRNNHPDYWRWAVLVLAQKHSCTAGEMCRQFDRAGALRQLIQDGYVDIYGTPFEDARLTLTQRGLDYLKENEQS